MLNILLIHCYTDYNKGDAGIIIATIQQLRREYPGCKVYLQSTYSEDDDNFQSQHIELREFADGIYGCIFPQLFIKRDGVCLYDSKSKRNALVKYSLINIFNIFTYKIFKKMFFLSDAELQSVEAIKSADIVISKGGSFLCSGGNMREDIGLARIMHAFYLAKLFGKRTVVLGQSLGPFDSSLSRKIFKFFSRFVDTFYVREHDSFELLKRQGVYPDPNKYKFCPDIAFALDSSGGEPIVQPSASVTNVGVTIVDFPFTNVAQRNNYVNAFRCLFEQVSERYNVNFFVFPQVIDEHPEFGNADIKLAKEIVSGIRNSSSVTVVEGNYRAIDLARSYADMDLFIATRLHSSIFATARNVPTLNIAYHGTKSEGTFKLLNCPDLVVRITDVDTQQLISLFVDLIERKQDIKNVLKDSVPSIQRDISTVIRSLI